MVLRTDEGAVAVSLGDIFLCCQDKGKHRERFTLQEMLFSAFPLHCTTYQAHAVGYQGTSAKRWRRANVLRALGGN